MTTSLLRIAAQALSALVLATGCTSPVGAPPAGRSDVTASPSPIANLPAMLRLEPGRMFAYETTTIRNGQRSKPSRTAYRIVTIFNDEDFQADYRVVTTDGKVIGEDKITFTRLHGIFYPAYTALHPTPEAFTDSETLSTPLGPIETKRTTASLVRPKAQTTDRYTYWIADRMLVRQHLVSESDGEEITELVAVE